MGYCSICRIEENADGLEGLRAQDHGAAVNLLGLARVAIDVEHALGAVAVCIHQHLVAHGVVNVRQVPRLERISNGGKSGVEVGVRHAATIARATVVAGSAAIDGPGEVRGACGRNQPAELFFHAVAQLRLRAGQAHIGLKLPIRQVLPTFGAAGHTDVLFHTVVIRSQILITQRPVFAVTIEGGSFQIEVTQAKAHTAPDIRAAAGNAQSALPAKRHVLGGGVGLFQIVTEPIVSVLVASAQLRLHGAGLLDNFRRPVPILQLESGLMLFEVLVRLRAAAIHQRYLQPGLRQTLARPSPRGARTDHNRVEVCFGLISHEMPPEPVKKNCERRMDE